MTAQQKEAIRPWAIPAFMAIVTIIGNAVVVGTTYGRLNAHTEDAGLHMPLEKKIEMFVTRREFDTNTIQRDRQFAEMTARLDRISAQVDALYQDRFAGRKFQNSPASPPSP